jgi:hypothetical protein
MIKLSTTIKELGFFSAKRLNFTNKRGGSQSKRTSATNQHRDFVQQGGHHVKA